MLNSEQKKAVEYIDWSLLILAWAGAGKTHTLTERVSFMIKEKNIDPSSIICVTFTNKAAREMKERITRSLWINFENITLYNFRNLPIIATFHAMWVFFLRKFITYIWYDKNFVIYDEDDKIKLIKNLLEEKNIDIKEFNVRQISWAISNSKNNWILAKDYSYNIKNNFQLIVSEVYIDYEKQLKSFNALDFDDILLKTLEILQNKEVLEILQNKYKYFLVDEYQDTNLIQYKIIKILASKTNNICVVWDDWQWIYSWRWANIANIFNFEKDYKNCKIVKLEQNYRSTKNIISWANFVIKNNIWIMDKTLWTDNIIWEKIKVIEVSNEIKEAEIISELILNNFDNNLLNTFSKLHFSNKLDWEDKIKFWDNLWNTAILYRTNGQSRVIEEALIQKWIPYIIYGWLKFYERKEIKDILWYLKFLYNPNDIINFKRIINLPSRKIWVKSIDEILKFKKNNSLWVFDVIRDVSNMLNLTSQAKKWVEFFYDQFKEFKKFATENCVLDLIKFIIKKIWYKEYLKNEYDEEEYESRIDNIIELENVASKYNWLEPSESLRLFLEDIALITDMDNFDDKNSSKVSLMTIHLSKWLEFDNVFITWAEEWIFPHSRSLLESAQLEEERRLMYVAMTRAKFNLYITRANERYLFWNYSANPCSRFVKEIPEDLVEQISILSSLKTNIFSNIDISFDINSTSKPKKSKLLNNDISVFFLWDKIKHVMYWIWTIVSLNWNMAEIAFSWSVWIKKFNIELAPIEKVNFEI